MSRRLETSVAALAVAVLLASMLGLLGWVDTTRMARVRDAEKAVVELEKQQDALKRNLDLLTRAFSEYRKTHP